MSNTYKISLLPHDCLPSLEEKDNKKHNHLPKTGMAMLCIFNTFYILIIKWCGISVCVVHSAIPPMYCDEMHYTKN